MPLRDATDFLELLIKDSFFLLGKSFELLEVQQYQKNTSILLSSVFQLNRNEKFIYRMGDGGCPVNVGHWKIKKIKKHFSFYQNSLVFVKKHRLVSEYPSNEQMNSIIKNEFKRLMRSVIFSGPSQFKVIVNSTTAIQRLQQNLNPFRFRCLHNLSEKDFVSVCYSDK